MSHRSRLASDVRTNAPLRVPTSTRIPLILCSFQSFQRFLADQGHTHSDATWHTHGRLLPLYSRTGRPEIDSLGEQADVAWPRSVPWVRRARGRRHGLGAPRPSPLAWGRGRRS